MIVNIKRLNSEAKIPCYAKPGDAGMDITATSKTIDEHQNIVYGTGLAFQIPKGYVGLLFPRSSVGDYCLNLSNCVGVLDSGYRGEVKFKYRKIDIPGDEYEIGDRIGQIIILPYPQIEFNEVQELEDSIRGTGCFGHTGRK